MEGKLVKILIICSGGVDSCSMAGKYRNEDVSLLTFDYGQKEVKETDVVNELGKLIGANVIKMDISAFKGIFGENQLSGTDEILPGYDKSVVVPLRNSMFLQIAMIYAYTNKFDKVVLGSHLNDITEIDGERCYPDCSPEFFKAFELAMDLGTFRSDKTVRVESASILKMEKSDLIKIGYDTLGDFIYKTWSCYTSQEKHCGNCESCNNRKRYFKEAGIEDRTKYE